MPRRASPNRDLGEHEETIPQAPRNPCSYKDGEQKRDFLYVKDAVEMTLHFAERSPAAGGLYNLGSGQANTWLALAGAIFRAMGKAQNIEFIEMPEALRGKYQYFTQADTAKIRGTGYERAMTPLADGGIL